MYGGYSTGFDHQHSMERCAFISWIIVPLYMAFKTGVIQTEHTQILDLFENGCLFFGTFIGLLSILIMSDEYYCRSHICRNYQDYRTVYYVMQLLMLASCLSCLYFGSIFNLAIMKGIGGTFLVLFLLDMEYHFLKQFRTGSLTGILFVLAVNLYALRYYILNYREYFIF
jgi:hypothetical protein